MEIPVYVFAGFLDSGKSNFINGILADGFALEDKTLLLRCEEGEEEYQPSLLRNVTVIDIEDQDELNRDRLDALEAQYHPDQVLIEYNGMWLLEPLFSDAMPANWTLYQIMTLVEASTFDLYARNMGQLMMEKITNADLIVFNRCTPELRDSLRQRNLRMVNRQASIYLEGVDGSNEDYLTGDECFFDMDQEVIDIPDDDFGIWYVDVMDHPDRYAGKKVHMKLVVCHSRQFPGVCCPGRFAMVCCENDITFLGLIAKGEELSKYKNHDWIEVTAEMSVEEHEAYQGEGPVMNMISVSPCEKLKNEVVSF